MNTPPQDQRPPQYQNIGRSLGTDYFRIADQLTEDELEIWRRARDFVDDEVLPVIGEHWEKAELPWPLLRRLGELGLVGDGIDGYGCPPMRVLRHQAGSWCWVLGDTPGLS
ncbi:acyl-CoA dehydrogenase family protein [Nakamurella sp.]|uniref:acyl-CoA dehydrogenase family protein n=1 Tax=Nakamurella sp. TaxID=1869182 RepID=UPI003783B660